MGDDIDMTGFYTSPFAAIVEPVGSGLSGMDTDVYSVHSAPAIDYSLANSDTTSFQDFKMPEFDVGKFITGSKDVIDWGLKATGTVFAANAAFKNQELAAYMQKQQMDILHTKVNSAADVAKVGAETANLIAKAKASAALTAQNAVNFGKVGGDGVMLWLTIIGVVFAGIQVLKSK